MLSINSINNINYLHAPAFKAKGVNENNSAITTNPISAQNVSFNGTEALAAYNYNFVNKNNDFNIPELQPICSLEDMNKIKGEKIYNSDGELVRIINKNKNHKIVYTPSPENKNIYDVEIFKDNEVIKRQHFYKSVDGNTYLAIYDDKNECCTGYKYDCGNLTLHHKEKHDKNKCYTYWAEKQEYEFSKGKIKKLYDKNLNLKQIIDFNKNGQNTITNYWKDKPISSETKIYENKKAVDDNINPFIDNDLIPAKYYEIGETNNIQGEKYYYSNGKLEKIVTPENKTYYYDLDGKFESIKFDNKEISLWGKNSIVIEEKLDNDTTKITHFDNKQPSCVKFINGEKHKNISWDKDNTITYQQCDDGYSVLQKTYDENKNLIDQIVWYHDDNY